MPTKPPPLSRTDALAELARHGITGPAVYLVDVLPLIEMIWADGHVQDVEHEMLDKFLRAHLVNLRDLAGAEVVDYGTAKAFVGSFLDKRPDPELMHSLRKLVPAMALSSSDQAKNTLQRQTILRWCLDLGASCVADYPYGDHERFSDAEKQCFVQIFESLRQPD